MVYVMSDIHGEKSKFDSAIKKINLTVDDKLYILGDKKDKDGKGGTGRMLQEIAPHNRTAETEVNSDGQA